MRKGILAVTAVCALALSGTAACSSSSNSSSSSGSSSGQTTSSSKPQVGVILPDTKSSVRYETQDRPNLTAAFAKAGVKVDIQNAQGDPAAFQTIAETMLNEGVKVLIIDSIDPTSGTAVINKAHAAGVKVIDYDRLTTGGGADFYVTFNNVQVGTLQGQGLVTALKAENAAKPKVAVLNGAPTDNNATQFAQGYDAVLNTQFANGTFVKGPNQSVPDWNNTTAGTIFENMLTQNPNIRGVLVANDGMANSVIAVLTKNHLVLPVTGQDATVQGLQHILEGTQTMTVFKNTKLEANAASQIAINLVKGQPVTIAKQSTIDPTTKKSVPSVLLVPESITKGNVDDVIKAGGTTVAALCTGTFAAKCAAAGIK